MSEFSETLRKLKLRSAANISGIEYIDKKASKRDFLHVWDITGLFYLILGGGFFIFCVLVLYTVLSVEISLGQTKSSTDIVTLVSDTRITEVDVHYVVIPPVDGNIIVTLPPAGDFRQGSYLSLVCATEFTQNGYDIDDESKITVNYNSTQVEIERTGGKLFMVYQGAWTIIREWVTPTQNP